MCLRFARGDVKEMAGIAGSRTSASGTGSIFPSRAARTTRASPGRSRPHGLRGLRGLLQTVHGVISYGKWGVWKKLSAKPWAARFHKETPLLMVPETCPWPRCSGSMRIWWSSPGPPRCLTASSTRRREGPPGADRRRP